MSFKSNENPMFRSKFSEDIFKHKYAHEDCYTWSSLARTLVKDVCGDVMSHDEIDELTNMITQLKFIPADATSTTQVALTSSSTTVTCSAQRRTAGKTGRSCLGNQSHA